MPDLAPVDSTAPVSSTGGPVTPLQIWQAIKQYGANAVQAAGIMGNWIAESSLNPEAAAMDSNGAMSYGLAQWNTASYPNAATLVTGNPASDLAAQVVYFFQTVPQSALTGATPQDVAANIAANYERCATCQPGGQSNTDRQTNAAQVAQWASSGNWPASSGQGSDQAQLGSAPTSSCAWQIRFPVLGSMCVFQKSELRGILGVALLVGAFVPAAAAFGILAQGVPGVRTLEGAAAGSVAGPEGTAAGAVAGRRSEQKARQNRARRAQERHDEATARQVEARKRDSAAGPALRDDNGGAPGGGSRARQYATAGQGMSTTGVPF